MTYEVIIKILDEVEYKGLFSLHEDKIYIRSLIDNEEYEDMFKQLIDDGYVDSQKYENNYSYNLVSFNNCLSDIFSLVKEKGLDISYEEKSNEDYTFSVVADGEDLNPEVIAVLNKGTKFMSLTQNLFKYANNVTYEPKVNIRASSYAVDIQEIITDDSKLIDLISSVNNGNIDIKEYLTNTSYSNAINSLFDVIGIETLDTLKISLKNKDDEYLNINAIKNLKRNLKNKLLTENFKVININASEYLRAFDNKKSRVLLDINPTLHLHIENENIFKLLKDSYDNEKNITIEGNYKSKQTILVTKVDVL